MKIMVVIALAIATVACSKDPFAPSSGTVDVTGTWQGTRTDSNGTQRIRYDLFQIQNDVTGFVSIDVPGLLFPPSGTVHGTMSGARLAFTWTFSGTCSQFGPACDLLAPGTATVNGATLAGSYACSANCTALVGTGTFTATKQ